MNVFIARTPYHVMLAHAVCMAERGNGEGNNFDASLVFTGTSLDAIEAIVSKGYWAEVLHFSNRDSAWVLWRSKAIEHWARQHFDALSVDTVHVSDDMNWRDQLLEFHLRANKRHLIEDGVGSYYSAKLSTLQYIFRNTVLRSLFAGKVRHYGAVSQSQGDRYFAVDPTAFPWVVHRDRVTTVRDELRRYISQTAMSGRGDRDIGTPSDLYLLTQPFYESDLLSKEQDLLMHQSLATHFPEAGDVLVKKHPREQDDMFDARLSAIASALPRARVTASTSPVPAELLAIEAKPQATFVSFHSTALINIRHLRDDLVVYFHPVTIDNTIASLFSRLGIRQIASETP